MPDIDKNGVALAQPEFRYSFMPANAATHSLIIIGVPPRLAASCTGWAVTLGKGQ
jgi:hypothetical protein